jgi:hypothetical protein
MASLCHVICHVAALTFAVWTPCHLTWTPCHMPYGCPVSCHVAPCHLPCGCHVICHVVATSSAAMSVTTSYATSLSMSSATHLYKWCGKLIQDDHFHHRFWALGWVHWALHQSMTVWKCHGLCQSMTKMLIRHERWFVMLNAWRNEILS